MASPTNQRKSRLQRNCSHSCRSLRTEQNTCSSSARISFSEAICEAVARPSKRFVAVKSAEQQALLVLHRVRQGFTAERTATINQLRGLLAEFGIVLPKDRYQLRAHIEGVLEDAENGKRLRRRSG